MTWMHVVSVVLVFKVLAVEVVGVGVKEVVVVVSRG
jgi:hypothetical protein